MRAHLTSLFGLLAALGGLLSVRAGANVPRYRVTDLGAHADAVAINDSGEVVGDLQLPDGHHHAFLFSKGRMHDLGTLGGPNSSAIGIRADGTVFGYSDEAEVVKVRANLIRHRGSIFVYAAGKMHPLRVSGVPDFSQTWRIRDLNNRGQFAIESRSQQGAILSQGVIIRLGTFVPAGLGWQCGWNVARDGQETPNMVYGEGYVVPCRINDAGEVIGEAATPTGECSFLYADGVLRELKGIAATDINAAGEIVGCYRAKDGSVHACLYAHGKTTDLGIPPGFKEGRADCINASGEIVGDGYTFTGGGIAWEGINSRPFLYADGHWIDLTARVELAGSGLKSLDNATRINARGQIIGTAEGPKAAHSYLLTPVAVVARN